MAFRFLDHNDHPPLSRHGVNVCFMDHALDAAWKDHFQNVLTWHPCGNTPAPAFVRCGGIQGVL